jgi:signal transduction histidine kinase
VLQESLHNAAKHSGASEISLSLKADPDQIVFEVADNGGGFDVQKTFARHEPFIGYGLASMQERAEIVDGALTIDSAPGQGTSIKMTLPQEPYASILSG